MISKKAKASFYRGAFYAGVDIKKEGEQTMKVHRLENWQEALPMASPCIVMVMDELTKDGRQEAEGHIFSLDDAREMVIDLIEELSKSGDPVAIQMDRILDELLGGENENYWQDDPQEGAPPEGG